ncbi:MAG: hypothetical protein OXF49_00180 [Candidatus Saccharibacteria bacterium]|nr:hypothetical protein [Candidatus Saccharibacteria bacterium]
MKLFKKILDRLTWIGLLVIVAFLVAVASAILSIADPSLSTALSIFTAGFMAIFTWQMGRIQRDQHKTNVYKLYWETILHSKDQELKWLERYKEITKSNIPGVSRSKEILEALMKQINIDKELDRKSTEIKKLIQNQYDDLVKKTK